MTDKPLDTYGVTGDLGKVDYLSYGKGLFENGMSVKIADNLYQTIITASQAVIMYDAFKQQLEQDFLLTPRGNNERTEG